MLCATTTSTRACLGARVHNAAEEAARACLLRIFMRMLVFLVLVVMCRFGTVTFCLCFFFNALLFCRNDLSATVGTSCLINTVREAKPFFSMYGPNRHERVVLTAVLGLRTSMTHAD